MNEKNLTRTETEYEKALAERNKLHAELERLTRKKNVSFSIRRRLILFQVWFIVQTAERKCIFVVPRV